MTSRSQQQSLRRFDLRRRPICCPIRTEYRLRQALRLRLRQLAGGSDLDARHGSRSHRCPGQPPDRAHAQTRRRVPGDRMAHLARRRVSHGQEQPRRPADHRADDQSPASTSCSTTSTAPRPTRRRLAPICRLTPDSDRRRGRRVSRHLRAPIDNESTTATSLRDADEGDGPWPISTGRPRTGLRSRWSLLAAAFASTRSDSAGQPRAIDSVSGAAVGPLLRSQRLLRGRRRAVCRPVRDHRRRRSAAEHEDWGDSWLLDAAIGYRLPRRRGIVSLELNNILDQNVHWQDDTFRSSEQQNRRFIPERSAMVRLNLNF